MRQTFTVTQKIKIVISTMRKFIARPENIWLPKFLIFPCGAYFVENKLMSLRFISNIMKKQTKLQKNIDR